MNPYIRPLARFTTAVTAAALVAFALTGCDPHEGNKCDNPGSYSTRVDSNGHRTSLSCRPSGVDSKGNQTYRWVKV